MSITTMTIATLWLPKIKSFIVKFILLKVYQKQCQIDENTIYL